MSRPDSYQTSPAEREHLRLANITALLSQGLTPEYVAAIVDPEPDPTPRPPAERRITCARCGGALNGRLKYCSWACARGRQCP